MKKYLYNGVPLPGLPEWDEVTHPHAYMYHGSGGSFFAVAETRGDPWVGGEGVDLVSFSDVMIYGVSDGAWTFMNSKDSMMHALKETDIFWVNTDLYHTDGTLYLAASDPIPIPAPVIDPLSMWLGWKAGNWVARQRGKAKPATGVYDDTMPIEWKMQDVANNKKIPFETYQIYSYNGLEFGRPDIEADSAYKYHLIEKYSSGYHYWCLKQPFVYINEDKEYAKIEGGYNYSLYICKTGEIGFAHHDDISGDDLKLNWEDIIWTNTNICDADGTVRMAATEPVYIRERVKDWYAKISNYIPSPEIFEKSAVSISYGGEEAIFTYVFGDNSYTGCTIVLFMGVTTYTNFVMLAIEKADNEVIPGEPGLYFLVDESIPSDVTFKFFVPDET